MDIQQHSGKQISQEFPPSTFQRSQEFNNNNNYSVFPVMIPFEGSPKLFEDVLIPVTSSAKDGSLFTVLENVPVKRTHRRRSANVDKDSLKCYQCNTSNTPEWRKGPDGPATLCNACGLAYAKKQKLGLMGQNVYKATVINKKNMKTTNQPRAQKVFNEMVVPSIPNTFPNSLVNQTPYNDPASCKKSHTFHEYMTPINSFYTGKPIKTTKTTTKRSKSKIGKIIPSIHEQPQLNEQVQAIMEKNRLSNSTGSGITNKFPRHEVIRQETKQQPAQPLQQQQQQQLNSQHIVFNFENNGTNSSLYSNGVNRNTNLNNKSGCYVYPPDTIIDLSPTNQEHLNFDPSNSTVPNMLATGVDVYTTDQSSFVPVLNVNNPSYAIQFQNAIPTFPNPQTQSLSQPFLSFSNYDSSASNKINNDNNINNNIDSNKLLLPPQRSLQTSTGSNIDVKVESSPTSELGSSPTEGFEELSVNTPHNNNINNDSTSIANTKTATNNNFQANGYLFGAMDGYLGNDNFLNIPLINDDILLPNSIINN
ncbi:hypothetical protein DICPUDRAFT_96381 [Dictyostelium purpureum]|uniref:GATA-type domain-containing protein n=1 Tax=Dictyostelium purpureum TaxID=5786 RepID=F0Z7R7_DICPU|nr:uncharacterized protein DICPUDRAFT_96381 [Dictyostelium purpureum]EGC39955.1 hypothetical protein DICPUDRAFT_96381 [Dictyostelium purpureum]|eukprot:XP_003283458.1 hypothetical protein DICPUDRAFT_96381 [Dictyostelium purpureum]